MVTLQFRLQRLNTIEEKGSTFEREKYTNDYRKNVFYIFKRGVALIEERRMYDFLLVLKKDKIHRSKTTIKTVDKNYPQDHQFPARGWPNFVLLDLTTESIK